MCNRNVNLLTATLFMAAAALTAAGSEADYPLALVWLAVGVYYLFLGTPKPKRLS